MKSDLELLMDVVQGGTLLLLECIRNSRQPTPEEMDKVRLAQAGVDAEWDQLAPKDPANIRELASEVPRL